MRRSLVIRLHYIGLQKFYLRQSLVDQIIDHPTIGKGDTLEEFVEVFRQHGSGMSAENLRQY